MENPIVVPFDLNTARKIKSGEMDAKHLDCLVPIRKLELQEYLSPEILKMEHI